MVGTLGQLAAAANGSNAIHVVLPQGMGPRAAEAALRRYGEVVHFAMLPSPVPSVACVFYDVRSAALAYESLGAHFCQFVPQCGSRAARLPGGMELDEDDLRGVSSIDPDLEESGAFVVHFYDIRDATKVRERAGKMGKANKPAAENPQEAGKKSELGSPSVKPFVPASFSASAKPFVPSGAKLASSPSKPSEAINVAHSLAMKRTVKAPVPKPSLAETSTTVSSSSASSSDDQQQVEVYLGGLPNSLCNEPCMDAVLEQAGLSENVVTFRTETGSPCGEVYVTLTGQRAAEQCLAHFHGRQWDTSGALVLAAVLPPTNKVPVSAEGSHQAKFTSDAPAAKAKPASKATAKAATAKANTAAKAAKAPKTLPPGLSMPPGLESCSSDYLTALSAAFDITLEKPAAKTIDVEKAPETESSTEAGISDEEECLVDEIAAPAVC